MSDMLRIHEEMLDIINTGGDTFQISYSQLADWFNVIKQEGFEETPTNNKTNYFGGIKDE